MIASLARMFTGMQQNGGGAAVERALGIAELGAAGLMESMKTMRDEAAFWRARAMTLENEVAELKNNNAKLTLSNDHLSHGYNADGTVKASAHPTEPL